MRVSGIDSMMPIDVKEGVELPKFIRTLTVETAEEEQQLRLFLMGALKVDERGCHALRRDFGAKALTQNPDVSNGSVALGSDESISNLSERFKNLAFDTKLAAINILSAVASIDGCFGAKTVAIEKLELLIQSL